MKKVIAAICLMLTTAAIANDRDFVVEEDIVLGAVELLHIETRHGLIRVRNVEEKINGNDFLDRSYKEKFSANKKILAKITQQLFEASDIKKIDFLIGYQKATLESVKDIYCQIDRDIREHERMLRY